MVTKKATFLRSGNKILKVGGAAHTEHSLTAGQYTWEANMQDGIFLTHAEAKPYRLPTKMFGDVSQRAQYVYDTWLARGRNTGVLLRGVKGTGKSLFLKSLVNMAIASGVPIVNMTKLVGNSLTAQLDLLRGNTGPMVLVCDEVEKLLDYKAQSGLLSFMDGTFDGNVLTLLTANEIYKLDTNFINRPGRILFSWNYEGLDETVTRDVVVTNLKDKSKAVEAIARISKMPEITFDVVTAIVEVMNIHNVGVDKALEGMNIEIADEDQYEYEAYAGNENPFQQMFMKMMAQGGAL